MTAGGDRAAETTGELPDIAPKWQAEVKQQRLLPSQGKNPEGFFHEPSASGPVVASQADITAGSPCIST
jgi:hypothetical protein